MINLNKEISEVTMPSSFNAQLKEYRTKGLQKYKESGLPGKKVEHWMKFDITPLKSISYKEGLSKKDVTIPEINQEFSSFCSRINIINGFVNLNDKEKEKEKFSDYYNLSTVSSDSQQAEIAKLMGTAGDNRGNYFYNLNSSLFSDPLLISVNNDKEKPPLYLAQMVLNGSDSIISNSRIIIEVQEGASLDLIQSFSGDSLNPYLNNSVTEIILHKNARLNHLVLQEDSDNAYVFNNLFVKQLENSEYNGQTLIAGAAISRNEYDISLDEENCRTTVTSLFLGKGNQLHNSDVTIHHEAPNCTSRTITKAIAGGTSQGVFRGFAIVQRDAQKSDAVQQFKTMLLNDKCQVNMEPHLEIWADDVKCSHGVTVGQLDPDQLFYVQSRGYTPEDARKILLEAFAADVAESISIDKVDEIIKTRIYKLMENLYE
ncbi:MAG: Fe-S cluster assembly protein SufD [Spirochaetaceae bacterium]|nr:Fe-S cluster assembly protein SufD [Spirochaetaceae bacterium]